ncbi:hypothetical protein R69619_03732 [Paraburkholderia nemoris]|uniref:Bpu10I family restriction endonuclease n=1 Tax=Paraburkholderia nemoris TaxID=2793076 RepID=UPI0019098D12|nr:Bpu10I family restriction endonuclease [Paraburkholderia nemoris]MBK3743145.1 Bpu10I family restriction endonuclease [Paraburkholderia aspalathi]CAE6768538.1 hypothetical protein R69619_03732 [Paraburkholderia nemoris]
MKKANSASGSSNSTAVAGKKHAKNAAVGKRKGANEEEKTLVESRPHGALLARKAVTDTSLSEALIAYKAFVKTASAFEVVDKLSVARLVRAFNTYRRKTIYTFEAGVNVPQENLRSTMMEEFLGWLFKDIFVLLGYSIPDNFRIGKSKSGYLKLTFAPHSFSNIFLNPNPRISVKNQDFSLGAAFELGITPDTVGAAEISEKVILPVVAVECKTYLAKNHLDMCSSTATDIKRAMPYCMYIVVCEFLKLDKTVSPELSDISEIYVFCKADNADRKRRKDAGLLAHPIHLGPVQDLFDRVMGHLKSVWWDPDTALKRGKVISRPF